VKPVGSYFLVSMAIGRGLTRNILSVFIYISNVASYNGILRMLQEEGVLPFQTVAEA